MPASLSDDRSTGCDLAHVLIHSLLVMDINTVRSLGLIPRSVRWFMCFHLVRCEEQIEILLRGTYFKFPFSLGCHETIISTMCWIKEVVQILEEIKLINQST